MNLGEVRSDTFYLDVRGGRRFCVLHSPPEARAPRGAIVHIHAFAEEMNKSRRAVALAARTFAARGWTVLSLDLEGCGDSSGDFGEATWNGWIEDALFAQRWVNERPGATPCWFWGLRAGCLVAAAASARAGGGMPLLFWQPVLSGRLHLTQFLRLKLASEALGGTDQRAGTKALRAQLAAGKSIEIAGYVLSPAVAVGLEQAELGLDTQHARILWCEISTDAARVLAPASLQRVENLRARGVEVETVIANDPLFWQTVEIAEAPALVAVTINVLERAGVSLV